MDLSTDGPAAPDAVARFHDFAGTAAADDLGREVSDSLYEMAALDPERWTILAVDLSVASGQDQVVVYAFDRTLHGVGSAEDVVAFAYRTGGLAVTAVELPAEVTVTQVMRSALRQVGVRLTARVISEWPLTIRDHVTASPA